MKENNVEQWKPIKGFEGLYEASSLGRIKSVERMCKTWYGMRRIKEQILKPSLRGKEGDQYFIVSLSKNNRRKTYGVHQLVALAFPEICGLPFEGAQCNHIDEDHFRNVPENLNWLSRKDNINHGTGIERRAKAMKGKLINRSDQSKTVYQYTTTHEFVKEWVSSMEIERQTGFAHTNISACCNGKKKTAYGFVWSYTHL